MFVPKSKPIAKSLPRCYVTRWEIFGVRVPRYRVKFLSFVHPIPMSIGRHKQELGIYAGTPTTDAESVLQKY